MKNCMSINKVEFERNDRAVPQGETTVAEPGKIIAGIDTTRLGCGSLKIL